MSGAEVFVGGGVDVIALGPGAGPAQVFLSTDGSSWRDVTPAGLTQQAANGLTVDLDVGSVSFVDPEHGWLYACDGASDTDVLLSTSDSGRTWTSLPPLGGCYHGDGPVQLLSSGLGYRELSPEPERSPFQRTTDGGRTWQTIPQTNLMAAPWGTAFRFTDPMTGYSASGIAGDPVPIQYGSGESQGAGYFATTRNGGATWTASSPPVSPGTLRLYDLPTPTEPGAAVLPALGGTERAPVLNFDVTTDNAQTWKVTSTLPVSLTGHGEDSFPSYPLPSVASATTWWVYQAGPEPHIERTTDSGRTWTSSACFGPPATNLVALSASTAFLVTGGSPRENDGDGEVEMTTDGGVRWNAVVLPAADASWTSSARPQRTRRFS